MNRRAAGASLVKDLAVEPQATAWQVVGAVVRGVAHERMGLPCQDAQDYRVLQGNILLIALADGAGSAAFSDQGAQCAVNEALHALAGSLESGLPEDNEGWQCLLREAFSTAHAAVLRLAEMNRQESVDAPLEEFPAEDEWPGLDELSEPEEEPYSVDEPPDPVDPEEWFEVDLPPYLPPAGPVIPPERAYATTLTCVVAADNWLAVGQIGDGLVVAGEGDDLFAVTHLQRGEYANETHFLTEAGALEQMVIEVIERPVSALAVMSDGLIRLALKLPSQEPHAPFFQPLFRVTAAIKDEAEASRQLSEFLGSARVNARTDDDKSLVLAVRAANPRISADQKRSKEHTMVEDRPGETAGSTGAGNAAGTNGIERTESSLDWERE